LLGYTITGLFVAYEIAFFLIAGKLGAWAPSDIPYTNMLNTKFPWIAVLLAGFFPAVNEEFLCRMFSIPFFEKIFRSRVAAVLLPAFIWGFAHANYPNQPFYIRGVEVGLLGIAAGFLMLRYGILPLLVWHFTVDAFATALLLFRSSNPVMIATAAVSCGIMLIPLLLSLGLYFARGGFRPEEGLKNSDEEEAPPPDAEGGKVEFPRVAYEGLSRRRLAMGAVLILAASLFSLVPAHEIGEFIRYPITGREAGRIADAFIRETLGGDPNDFQVLVLPEASTLRNLDIHAILSRGGVRKLNEIGSRLIPCGLWKIRYFIPLRKEEMVIHVDPRERKVCAFERLLPEDAPAPSMMTGRAAGEERTEPPQARAVAEGFLALEGHEIRELQLKDSSFTERKNRRDHELVWEHRSPEFPGARLRIAVGLQGSRVSRYGRSLKLEESWERRREEHRVVHALLASARILVFIGFFISAGILFVTRLRDGQLTFKRVLSLSIPFWILAFLGNLNQFKGYLESYNPATPYPVFLIQQTVSLVLSSIAYAFVFTLALGILYPGIVALKGKENRWMYVPDAVFLAVLSVAVLSGLKNFSMFAVEHFPFLSTGENFEVPRALGAYLPAFSALFDSISVALFICAAVAVIGFAYRKTIRSPYLGALSLVAVVAAFVPEEARTAGEFAFGYVVLGVEAAVIVLLVKAFFRGNALAYPLAALTVAGLQTGVSLIHMQAPFFVGNGIVVLLISLGPFALLSVGGLKRKNGVQ
jgi:membrane protease YdiL (CAAX protease family)